MLFGRRSSFALSTFVSLAAAALGCSGAEAPAEAAGSEELPTREAGPAASNDSVPDASVAVPDPSVCGADREALLSAYRPLFDARRGAVQARLTGDVTADNWSTVGTVGTWGPRPTTYAPITPPAVCGDASAWKRELLFASINYWVDRGINYCHHHVPGWTPPNEGKLRSSTGGSTSGGDADAMTCTANRFADGHQRVSVGKAHECSATDAKYCDSPDEIDSPDAAKRVQWNGLDCSDFTSWAYNFAGLTTAPLPTGIGTQACTLTQAPGVLLDINAANIESVQADGHTLQDKLRPGDLLFVLAASSENVAHVVTWTGLRWKDLQASSAAAAYDPAKVGEPSSRLGGDLQKYGLSLAALESENPYMIVDSHYAGPAYRPFHGWYRGSVTHVRRVIDAPSVDTDPVLVSYKFRADAGAAHVTKLHAGSLVSYEVLVAPKYAASAVGEGHRLYAADAANSCLRDGALGQK